MKLTRTRPDRLRDRLTRRRRSQTRAATSAAHVQPLESRVLMAADFRISEFMASNVSTLADEDAEFNDWIEIRNVGDAAGDLAGYRLTDAAAAPAKWTFPSVTVPAGGHLVVFASGKNRTNPAANLHTNFSLNADGEYLALFGPDGVARTAFSPAFPDQDEDISYGTDYTVATRPLRYFAEPTPGAANARAEAVINEIHYDPDVKTQLVEFVELHNPGTAPVDLSGAYFSDGITYTFAAGTTLAPGGYLVLAQNAAQFQAKYAVAPHGQYVGALSNDGETVRLRNAAGGTLDMVDYQPGFPWPTVGDAPGYSIELINPDFENDVGGNWRAQPPVSGPGATLFPSGGAWRYFKGNAEPSSDWKQVNAPGTNSWSTGNGPVGYDANSGNMGTLLSDMRDGYTSVYLRKTFNVADPLSVGTLRLEAMFDDGFNVYLNGQHVYQQNVPSAEMPRTGTASSAIEDNSYRPFNLPTGALRAGTNVVAVHFLNAGLSNSSDAFFDARLISTAGSGPSPSPGRRNSVFADNAAPQMRQVNHSPEQPRAGEVVTVTTKVTDPDGVASVNLLYQLVDPGNYIAVHDPAYQTNWTSASMRDDGAGGDVVAGDGVYTAQLPASVQTNRRLVRYRVTAADARGASITAPYADDSVPNFAYFVYNGVPTWTGAARPGVTAPVTYGPEVMNSVPAYHLISKNADVENATWNSRYSGDNYQWKGTLVYDGVVYDHVGYRARGGVWRYAMVKNMWKFDFNHNHGFQARDDYGNKYPVKWDKLNLSAVIQQGNFWHRGEQGLFESVGMALFNKAGAVAPVTNFLQLRVVDNASENGANQYTGDLWGLYLAVEQPDGNFLDQHGLPDGNLYKMEGGSGSLNNQGPTQPTDKSDLNAFMAGYRTPGQTEQWFRDNMNLDSYYGYRAIVDAIHHYDIDESAGKNYFFYHNPVTDKWETTVWDLDLTWSDNMYGGGDEPFRDLIPPKPNLGIEYRNRVRELRDLLWNPEQTGALIDEMAAKIYTPGQPSFVDVDRAMWDWNPLMADSTKSSAPEKAGQGRFYAGGSGISIPAPGGFAGMIQKMKNYVVTRGAVLDGQAADAGVPARPTVTYAGAAGFPADGLRFRTSAYSDPQANAFAAMEWRLAEITDPNAPGYDPKAPKKYEIDALWESGELTTFNNEVTVPARYVEAGKTYRVRVRWKDSTGRWSNWSAAPTFVASAPDATVKDSLRISEIHYHPAPNAEGPPAADEMEFVELTNIGSATIDLEGVNFDNGIDYTFGDVSLAPGEYIVVAGNRAAFLTRYAGPEYAGINLAEGGFSNQLANNGERVVLLDATNQVIHDFTYFDTWHPSTDGEGASMVAVDPAGPLAAWGDASGWRPSNRPHGSPGLADDAPTDTTPPTVDVVDVAPDLRNTPVGSVTIEFSEPVVGFDLSDLSLARDGGASLLTAAQTLVSNDGGRTWTLGNLSGITTAGGSYALRLDAAGSGITDAAGNPLAAGATDNWTTDVTGPTADVTDVAPDPRNTAIGSVTIVFSEPITGIDLADLSLTRNGSPVALPASAALTSADEGRTWTLGGISAATAADGAYVLSLAAAGSGIADLAGNPLAAGATDAWTTDGGAPTADIVDVTPDPRNTGVGGITIVFSEPVTGFTRDDLTLTRDGGANLLTDSQTLTSSDGGRTWTLGTLSAVTGAGGSYTLRLDAAGSGIADAAGNPLAVGATDAWTTDAAAPTADITDVTPDPRATPVDSIRIVFSEPVTGFDLSDLQLLPRNGPPNNANVLTAAQTLTTADNVTWTLANLAGITGPLAGGYTLVLRGSGSGITDAVGNLLSVGAQEEWSVAAVYGRHAFYNNSSYDGRNRLATGSDIGAVATDKTALLPGGVASFANVTSYGLGINGVMVDIAGLPIGVSSGPGPSNFTFRMGDGGDPATWALAPAPLSMLRMAGAGVGGSDRLAITWADGAIKNTWLQVTVKATGSTGLPAADVFYFGNLVGETGDSGSPRRVSAVDISSTRARMGTRSDVNGRYDFNRDGRVNVIDLALVRMSQNQTLGVPSTQSAAAASTGGGTFSQSLIQPAGTSSRLPATRTWYEEPRGLLA